jgi:hypothetical protein
MKKIILILFSVALSNLVLAGIYSSSVSYKHIQGYEYEIYLDIYKDTVNITHPLIIVDIGNNSDTLYNYSEEIIGNYLHVKYKGNHTFIMDGDYVISAVLIGREGGIWNIPYSINTGMTIEASIKIDSLIGINNSSFDSLPLIDSAIVNQLFSVNLSSNDIDGDSLSYKLKPCRGDDGLPIIGYTYPAQPPVFTLDSISGILAWNTPQYQGEYSVLIQIEEWRSGILISYTEREHFIVVELGSGINNSDNKMTGKVDVYPNPSSDIVNLNLKNSNEKIGKLEIFNVVGKQVYSKSNIQNSSTRINVRAYKKGVYYFRIITSNKDNYLGKFIVF